MQAVCDTLPCPLSALGLGALGVPRAALPALKPWVAGSAPSSLLSCEHLGEAPGLVRAPGHTCCPAGHPGPVGLRSQRALCGWF